MVLVLLSYVRFRSVASDICCRGHISHCQKRAGTRQQRSINNLDLPQVKPRSQSCSTGLDNIRVARSAEQEAGLVTPTAPRRANKGVITLLASLSSWPIGGAKDESGRSIRDRSKSNDLHERETDELVDMLTLLEDPLGLSLFRR